MSVAFYKIISNNTDKIYIGSTTRNLRSRLINHYSSYNMYLKQKFNYVTVFEVLKEGDCSIVLLEMLDCPDAKSRYTKEGEYIKANSHTCVNKLIPGRDYKGYYQDNKDRLVSQSKAYNLEHKNRIKEKGCVKCVCICGISYTHYNKSSHLKSARHGRLLELVVF